MKDLIIEIFRLKYIELMTINNDSSSRKLSYEAYKL